MYLLNAIREYISYLAVNSYLPSFFQYNFVINALISSIFLGPILGIFGTLIISKKIAFFSEAIGHSALTGIALGIFLGESPTSPYIMLYAYCIIFAILITYTKNRTRMSSDTLIGIFLSVSIAIGGALIILIASKANIHILENLLFGSILTITDTDIFILAISSIALLSIALANYNSIMLGSFNSNLAKVKGVNVKLLDYLFILLVTLVTLSSIKIIGTALVEALFLIPAASSKNISSSTKSFFWFSIMFSLLSTILGILIPLILNIPLPSGASIIIISAIFFIFSIIYRNFKKN